MRRFLIATVALFAAMPAAAQTDRQKIDTTFAFAKGGTVELGIVSGEIVVTGWAQPEVRIHASIETGYLDASFGASHVSIKARSRRNRMSAARYEVSVPVGTEVRASTVSGRVTVRGTADEVAVNTVSGSIEVRDASERVALHTVSGEMRGEKLRGRIRVNSVSGDLTLDDIAGDVRSKTVSGELHVRGTLEGLEFESVSGDLDFRGDLKGDGTFSATTHSGDLRLTLPGNVGATLDLQTFSGEVRPGFPLTLQPGEQPLNRRNRRMRFDVNGGGPRLTLETFSGDIIIDKGAPRSNKEE
jgi:DUF4097 and DUF4098 domain-containing protein YvlB